MDIYATIHAVDEELAQAARDYQFAVHDIIDYLCIPRNILSMKNIIYGLFTASSNLRETSFILDDVKSNRALLIQLRETALAELNYKKLLNSKPQRSRGWKGSIQLGKAYETVLKERRKLRKLHNCCVSGREMQSMIFDAKESIRCHGEGLCFR